MISSRIARLVSASWRREDLATLKDIWLLIALGYLQLDDILASLTITFKIHFNRWSNQVFDFGAQFVDRPCGLSTPVIATLAFD